MHQHGDELGYIGFKCLADNRSFEAYQGRCENGEVVSTNATSTCHEVAPYCCQSGKPGNWGAATCLSKKENCTPWKGNGKLFPQETVENVFCFILRGLYYWHQFFLHINLFHKMDRRKELDIGYSLRLRPIFWSENVKRVVGITNIPGGIQTVRSITVRSFHIAVKNRHFSYQ